MVDSRQKGATAETNAKKILIKYTGLNWQRTPMSGALDEKHGLKGDLYIPNSNQIYCVEVKHYKDDHLTSKLLTGKTPMFYEWWSQTLRESKQVDRRPLLIFKFDRSKFFVATKDKPLTVPYLYISEKAVYAALLEDWLEYEDVEFVK